MLLKVLKVKLHHWCLGITLVRYFSCKPIYHKVNECFLYKSRSNVRQWLFQVVLKRQHFLTSSDGIHLKSQLPKRLKQEDHKFPPLATLIRPYLKIKFKRGLSISVVEWRLGSIPIPQQRGSGTTLFMETISDEKLTSTYFVCVYISK